MDGAGGAGEHGAGGRVPATRPSPRLGPVVDFIEALIDADRMAQRKRGLRRQTHYDPLRWST